MEILVLSLFCVFLLVCIAFDFSILYALCGGLVLFLAYGKRKGFSWRELAKMAFSGVKKVRNVLISFLFIGILTALWRDAGTIPTIVCYASRLINPSVFLLMTFLLNCLVSCLTGTAFGTSATMGVICATVAAAVKINPVLVGGAVLSGAYFGDRCSPVSTSALLVSQLTHTSIFVNIKNMLRTAIFPFIASCVLYALVGIFSEHSGHIPDLYGIFGAEFRLHPVTLLPAGVIVILSLFKVNVRLTMTASILVSIPICLFVQHTPVETLPGLMLSGFTSENAAIAPILNGGGIVSMLRAGAIVCLSSSYSGIFKKTGLLDGAKRVISTLAKRTTPYISMLCASTLSSVIACNQTLTVMLTHQLCRHTEESDEKLAIHLEDTAVMIPALIPWSTAAAVPIASVGCSPICILFAFFVYLLPIWRTAVELIKKTKSNNKETALSAM